MKAKEVAAKFTTLKKEIGKIKSLEDVRVKTRPAYTDKQLAQLEKQFNFIFPESLKAYYQSTNGHRISWKKHLPNQTLIGQSTGLSLPAAINGKVTSYYKGELRTDVYFYPTHLDAAQKETLQQFWLFEQLYLDQFVLIAKENWHDQIELYLYEPPYSIKRIELSFAEYLQNLFDNKAQINWQQQFISQDARNEKLVAQYKLEAKALAAPLPVVVETNPSGYPAQLEKLLAQLKGNKTIEGIKITKSPAPHPSVIEKIERELGTTFPSELLDFYTTLNGFRLYWKSKLPDGKAFFGIINIPPLEVAFGGKKAEETLVWDEYATYGILWADDTPIEQPTVYQSILNKRIFDQHLTSTQLLMSIEDGKVQFYSWVDQQLQPLAISFQTLMGFIFATGGLENYPFFLTKYEEVATFKAGFVEKVRTFNLSFSM